MTVFNCPVGTCNLSKSIEFQILVGKYFDHYWDGEIDPFKTKVFFLENSIIWDLLNNSIMYANSRISVVKLLTAGFSEDGIYEIYLTYQSLLYRNQYVLSNLINEESISTVQKIHQANA
ncbi:MAG: hypothetical protein H7196_01305 [candidate division SR1 bacterium]|nr:hypothetical protein [candidate division SR1 bacterium]